ncbi:hypothetical protein HON22_01985 [Candidatus Peregrinibacteria bacterium]|jgi:hypothetical protein|nr:hypothetical protein [Candidatus Peregrinibacteria bacterium]
MPLSPPNNFESRTDSLIHENLFHDLKENFETASREHFHNVLQRVSGNESQSQTDTQEDPSAKFHTNHLSHHEFVDEKHHSPILNHIQGLVEQASPQDLSLILHYIHNLKAKSSHISNYNFESQGHTEEESHLHKENATKLEGELHKIYESIKHNILLEIDPENTKMNQEDFRNLLLERETKQFHLLLEINSGTAISNEHLEKIHEHKNQRTAEIVDTIDEHKKYHENKRTTHEKIDELSAKVEGKTHFNKASKEHYARFHNEKILPATIKAGITRISQGFRNVDNWAVIGSAAVATQSEKKPEKIDDIDISFSAQDIDKVLENFNVLKDKGLIFLDSSGKEKGFHSKSIDDIGKSEKINGYIDSGVTDPNNPGENILVEFEAFGESENAGIMQIGSMERDITLMEEEGEKVQFIGPEALVDQYVVNLLYEFETDSIDNYHSSQVKAKDLMRIEKLSHLGCSILKGVIEAINRTCKRYPKEGNKLMDTLEKEKNYILMLEKIHDSFEHDMSIGHKEEQGTRQADSPDKPQENTLETFTELFDALSGYKWKLRLQYEKLLEVNTPDELFQIQQNIEMDNKVFTETFHKIKESPDGKFLHFMAISRLSENFLKNIYLRMNQELYKKFPNEKLNSNQLKKRNKLVILSMRYNISSLKAFHTHRLDEYQGTQAANAPEYQAEYQAAA